MHRAWRGEGDARRRVTDKNNSNSNVATCEAVKEE